MGPEIPTYEGGIEISSTVEKNDTCGLLLFCDIIFGYRGQNVHVQNRC